MKKLLLPLLILCAASSISCMNNSSKQKQSITIQLKQRNPGNEMYDFALEKELLPKSVAGIIEKIEKWPDWAKQTTGTTLCGAYLVGYLIFIGSYF